MENRIAKIQEQEKNLNQANEVLDELEALVKNWQNFFPQFNELMNYYNSSQWHDDFQESNRGTFKDFPCGVLSEDAVYDMYHRQRTLNLKIIRVALDYLQ